MSLDIYLEVEYVEVEVWVTDRGSVHKITRAEWDELYPGRKPVLTLPEARIRIVFHANVTHNLNSMAEAAAIYEPLWRPEEVEITTAHQLIVPLTTGLERLRENPEFYATFNPPNGWGTYEGLVEFVQEYLDACKQYPTATVRVSR